MSRAIENTNALQSENGVKWIDSTVMGMGRGPGNAKTEYIVLQYKEIKEKNKFITITKYY